MKIRLPKLLTVVAAVAVLSALAAACGGDEEEGTPSPTPMATLVSTPAPTAPPSTPTRQPLATPSDPFYTPAAGTANVFGNGGMEEGRRYWFSLRAPDYELSTEVFHSGATSALLRMRVPAETEGEWRNYLVQEVAPEEFPEIISGYYRVENWNRGTEKQYLQFVPVVFGATNLIGDYSNHQMRYLLDGIDEEPFPIGNAFFVFLGEAEPTTDEWVYFEVNLAEDFERFWGAVPEGFSKIRVLFEAASSDKIAGETGVEADVYYDDLYMGPASENPNQP
jgi:hypothetical protein